MSKIVDLKVVPQFSEAPQAARDFFAENGYYVELQGGFSAAECEALISEGKEFEEFTSGKCTPKMMPHRERPAFLEALRDRRIVSLVQAFLGERVHGMQSEFFFCKPGTAGFANHQDNFYVEAEGGQMISAWMPLVDVNKSNGCLIIYPQTNKAGDLPTRKLGGEAAEGQDPNARQQEAVVPEAYEAYDLHMPRGSILFIHSRLVHGSNQNQSQGHRFVLLNTFIKDGISFRPGNYAKRAPVDLGL